MPNVSNLVKTIQDIMRKDAGTYGDAQRLEQLGWMFFLKIFDDREQEMELLRDSYKSPLPQHLRWSSWAKDEEGITGDALLDFINNTLLPKLKALSGGDKLTALIRTAFEDANNYMKNGTLMRQVINKINGIDFNASDDRQMFGDIYEKLLKDLQSAGNAGEFYTPRAVTQFIVEQVNPRLGESVLDPACGTGGFLVCAIEHLRKQAKTEADERSIQECFAGIEKKHLPHVLCMTNLLLHGIDVPSNVRHDNTLARPLRDWGPKERVDCIVTNPPFGGMEEDGIEANYPAEFRTRETADLFLVLLMKLLKPGGRAGLVLPDGTLFGEGVKTRIKEALLTECNLHTIVRLPNGVFNPYTGIRTNLLFFTKGTPTKEVWYYEHPYPPGAKSYNKGKPIRIEEFDPIKAWWGDEKDGFKSRVENERAWRVSMDQIKAGNFNLDLKNPHNPDTGPGDVDHLLPEYEKLLAQIAATRAALKQEFNRGLQKRVVAAESLFESSELFAVAPNAVEKMRELVLQLGIQGKLVEQAPGDEPAKLLLERIQNTKEQLISDRSIRRQDTEPISDDQVPFSIPKSWVWTRLGEIGDWGSGSTPTRGNHDLYGGETIWLKSGELNDNQALASSEETVTELALKTCSFRRNKPGDVLLAMYGATIGKVAILAEPAVTNQAVCGCTPFDGIFNRYLFSFLLSQRARFHSMSEGGAQPNISKVKIVGFPFPLPPLAEQKRIVAKVDELMSLVDRLETLLADSRTTAASLLNAFVAELTNPE